MEEIEINAQILNWLPSLELRILFIIAFSALLYILMTAAMRRTSRLITQRYGTASSDMKPCVRSINKLAQMTLLIAISLVALDLILSQLSADLGLFQEWPQTLTGIAIIAYVAVLLYWILLLFLDDLRHAMSDEDDTTTSEIEQRTQTISTVLRSTGLVLIVSVASMMILRQLGVDIAPILAGAGIAGIAIGLGAQALVKDMLSGFFILLEDHFGVGDFIEAAGVSGTVERMSLRATWLHAISGTLHVIPNGEIRTVSNRNRGWARVIIDIRLPYDENIDRAEELLGTLTKEIVEEKAYASIVRSEPSVLSVAELAESWVTLKILLMTSAGQQWAISRDLQKRIVKSFNQEGIRFAYPRSVVHVVE